MNQDVVGKKAIALVRGWAKTSEQ